MSESAAQHGATPSLLTIHTDGAARGNPGPAACAYTITGDGIEPIEEADCLGEMTNNQAEYTALVRALEHAVRLGPQHRLLIYSDSELMVKQMNGLYRVKNEDLRGLWERAQQLRRQFPVVTISHVRREQNGRADELCNQALDGRRPARKPTVPPKVPPPASGDGFEAEAVACLKTAALAWGSNGAAAPPPEEVWKQLKTILQRHGVLPSAGR